MKMDLIKDDRGSWSAFIFIFLITLGLLGLGAYSLMQSEGVNIANQTDGLRAEYAATSGVFFALGAFQRGALTSDVSLEMENTNVAIDTQQVGDATHFLVSARRGDARRKILVEVDFLSLEDVAIYSDSTVTGVSALDSAGHVDNNRLIKEAKVMPEVDNTTLKNLAKAQGHYFAGDYNIPDGYPSLDFYADPVAGIPNVTWVEGNVTLSGNEHIYGIVVIGGNLTVNGTPRFEGVIYMPNKNSMLINGGGSPSSPIVDGGILSFGLIRRSGGGSRDRYIKHNPEYMRKLCEFVTWQPPVSAEIVSWRYLKSTD